MKVGIDAFGCDHGRSGLGAYLLYFVHNLPQKSDINFEVFGMEIDKYTYTSDTDVPFVSVNIADKTRLIDKWHKRYSGLFFKKQAYDFVIYPGFENISCISNKTKSIVIINSPVFLNKNLNKKVLKRNLKKADYIIAASLFIQKNLIESGVESQKITVIHNGIDHKLFFQSLDFESDYVEVKPFSIKKPYFIYGSRLSGEEKKHIQLIKAFELFKDRTNSPHRLVLSGEDGEYSEKVRNLAFNSKYASDIFITGYFPNTSIPKLYEGASACVFPAVNEGVGLPVIEAMACGIPVLCSSSGVLKEMGGDVPLYFDSDKVDEIAEAMQKIIEDEALYKEKVAQGLEWSRQFNWEETVLQTLKVIDKGL